MKIGFIGLGIMGKPMSRNLLRAGYEVMVYTHQEEVIAELVNEGAIKATGVADLSAHCPVIITMLPNSPQVREVALGENGILEAAKPGTILIDMSSIDPMESRSIGEALVQKGIRMLDAPVSGGEPKAIEGTLAVMVGGSKTDFDECYGLLKTMASSVTYVGELGAGNIAKLANQIVVALNIAAVSEALIFAQKAGASPELVYQAIRGGLAGSTVMDAKAPLMLERKFDPGFRIDLHIKDLNNALNAGHAIQATLPLTAQIMEMMQVLKNDGHGGEDHSGLIKYYEKMSSLKLEP